MLLIILYSLVLLSLSIYSYSQIDLNLTLSANEVYQALQQQLIYLGYFNRPLSTVVFVVLLALLYIFYLIILRLVNKKKLSEKGIYLLIIATVLILVFSYPSFSHDIFNYLFDARIITRYHENPYIHKALDFPSDPWIRFMHWTHRTYPYGPVWLILTLPFSFLGFGKFVPTLLSFKLMFAIFHGGNIFLIEKILTKLSPKSRLIGISFYGLNPLILIESLVSPHNEVLMLFFLLLAIYLLFNKRNVLSIVSLLFSIGTKFVTAVVLPLFLLSKLLTGEYNFRHPDRSASWRRVEGSSIFRKLEDSSTSLGMTTFQTGSKFLVLNLLLLIIPLIYQIYLREPYSWYFIPFLGIGALLVNLEKLKIFLIGTSLAFLLRYAPFLYRGNYSPETYHAQLILSGATIVIMLLWMMKRKKQVI